MLNRLGVAAPSWLERWLTPVSHVNIIRAYAVHPHYCRIADWQINAALDDNLSAALINGHSVACIHLHSSGVYTALPYLWHATYADDLPRLSQLVKMIEES